MLSFVLNPQHRTVDCADIYSTWKRNRTAKQKLEITDIWLNVRRLHTNGTYTSTNTHTQTFTDNKAIFYALNVSNQEPLVIWIVIFDSIVKLSSCDVKLLKFKITTFLKNCVQYK